MYRRKSLVHVFLEATKIYSPEYLADKDFLFPVEIVLSIAREFNIKEWFKASGGKEKVVAYLEDIKYPEGLDLSKTVSYLWEAERRHVPIIVFY